MTAKQKVIAKKATSVLITALLTGMSPGGGGLWPAVAFAQSDAAPPALTAAQLDTLVSPVALYPDPLLAQVLSAATFPTDVVQADRWVKEHKNLKGQQLTDAVVQANLPYDPSIVSLIQFPTVLDKLSKELDWTTGLGNAMLTQRGDVMDAVQRMRKKAEAAGNLKSTEQVKVVSSPTTIEIQPANPQVIYVPVYSTQVVYAPPPPPPPGPSAGTVAATALIAFGVGVAVGAAANNSCCWYGGSMMWHSHTVVVANSSFHRTWATRGAIPPPPPYYRHGGAYPVGRAPIPPSYRNTTAYRGNTTVNNVNNVNVNVNTGNRNVNTGNVNTGNVNTNRTVNAGNTANVDRSRSVNAPSATTSNRGAGGSRASANSVDRGYSQPSSSGRATAFSGAQNGRSEAAASRRGQQARGSRR